jgi:RHS repeat-associated protein
MTRGSATSYTYDRADRITAAGRTSYTVNANGNLTARGADTFGYDQANGLKTATVGATTASYAWDGDGKRATATVNAATTSYLYDVNQELPVVLEDGTRKYVWGPGLGYAVSGSALEVYHTDGLGSTRALTDGTGAVTNRYETDEFGVPVLTGSSTQPFRYTGEQFDPESSLVYLRSRMYDPAIGRFVQRDGWPGDIGRPTSLNRYPYVEHNPATLTDPSGEVPIVATCFIGAGVSLATDVAFKLYTGEKITGNQVLRSAVTGCAFGAGGLVLGQLGSLANNFLKFRRIAQAEALLTGLKTQAQAIVPQGTGHVYGTHVHKAFADLIGTMGRSDLWAEVSYAGRRVVKYGYRGSVRVDAILGSRERPIAKFALKTGSAHLTQAREARVRPQLPGGWKIPFIEI